METFKDFRAWLGREAGTLRGQLSIGSVGVFTILLLSLLAVDPPRRLAGAPAPTLAPPTVTQAPAATQIPTAIATATLTPTAAPTATVTPTLTATAAPTSTPTPTATSTSVPTSTPTPVDVLSLLRAIGPKEALSYSVQTAIQVERPEQSLLFLRFGRERVLLIAAGTVTAGINLGELQPDQVGVRGDSVEVLLPRPAIMSTAVDEQRSYVFAHSVPIFAKGDPGIETEARRLAPRAFEEWAMGNNILDQAEEHMVFFVRAYLQQLGFRNVTVRVQP